jgi:hypothetical protein
MDAAQHVSGTIMPIIRSSFKLQSQPPADRPARPRTQHDYHHDTKVQPEAATAVIELLMVGGKTPETCWAVNKRQDNKLKNCCVKLVIYLNCTMMHGLTNLGFKSFPHTSNLVGSSSGRQFVQFSLPTARLLTRMQEKHTKQKLLWKLLVRMNTWGSKRVEFRKNSN